MKTSIKSTIVVAALALLSTGAFAANKNTAQRDTLISGGEISASLAYDASSCEIDVNIAHATQGSSTFMLYDEAGNVVMTDKFSIDSDKVQKSYLVTDLAAGNYTIEVTSNNKTVKQGVVITKEADEQYYSL